MKVLDALTWVIYLALYFALLYLISGCSVGTAELGTHRTISVEKKPYRITLSGDIKPEDYNMTVQFLEFLAQQKFRDTNLTDVKIEVHGSQNTTHVLPVAPITASPDE